MYKLNERFKLFCDLRKIELLMQTFDVFIQMIFKDNCMEREQFGGDKIFCAFIVKC